MEFSSLSLSVRSSLSGMVISPGVGREISMIEKVEKPRQY